MNATKPGSERLYLHRDENDEIFVEATLHQHHIDGIRFLYKQFQKKQPGVIINNPLGYGNSLQVALFLGAIQACKKPLLQKPILILCDQSEELNWLEHFQKHTQCYNIGVRASSPFVKKFIFINTMEHLEQFCRGDWSVLVVDNDAFLRERALQDRFKADFKIWITPVDMKNKLETFASIYKWIFPKEKINIEDFKATPGDYKDAVSKAILLDAFLEDIVCRTTLQTPFENPFDKSEDTPRKSSKKNKDATGTKVKRSKRSLDVAGTSHLPGRGDAEAGTSAAKVPKTEAGDAGTFSGNEETKCDDPDNKSDVESFIRNESPLKFNPFHEFDNISRNSQDSQTELLEDEPMFDTADRLNKLLESNVPMDIVENPEFCFLDSDSNSDSLLPMPKTFDDCTSQVSNDSDYVERKRSTPDFVTDNMLNEIKEEMSESHNSNMFEESVKSDVEEACCNVDESENVKKELGTDVEDTKKDGHDRGQEKLYIDEEKSEIVNEKPDVVNENADIVKMESENVKPDVKVETNKEKESPRKHDLDAKLKEMDERAFKKFQGSILDSLF